MKRYLIVFDDGEEIEIQCKEYSIDAYGNIRFLDNDNNVMLLMNSLRSLKYIKDLDLMSN